MISFKRAARVGGYVLLVSGTLIACGLVYSYRHGGKDNYFPPADQAVSPAVQVTNDLTRLSQAVESYYVKHLRYPTSLELLQPEFLSALPVAPVSNTFYRYETDGSNRYGISVSDPQRYNLKEMRRENGRIIQH